MIQVMAASSRAGFPRLPTIAALFLAAGSMVTGGCATIHDHHGYLVDQALLDSVQPRIDNKASVERTLGRPTFTTQFGDPAWYYVSVDTRQLPFRGPHATAETILRVRFDAGDNVLAVDRAGMDHVVDLRPDHASTPTLGRHRSLLEDIFSNIGTVGTGGAAAGSDGSSGGSGGRGGGTGPNGS